MSNLLSYYMHEAGSIPGFPGPNHGLWPGGVIVTVDLEANEVVSVGPLAQVSSLSPVVEASIEEAVPESPETSTPAAPEEEAAPDTFESR